MTAVAPALRERLEAARRRLGVPALGAAVVEADGRARVEVVGVRVRGAEQPVTADDRWHLGSCGKAFTAALYARLVEQGRAAWQASLAELFPDLARRADPAWGSVTIDQLLTHRAGLPANLSRRALRDGARDPRPVTEQRTEVATRALAVPPRGVGSFRYSNLGYILAGAAVERIAGVRWEEALEAELLRHLGIASGGFGPPTGAAPCGHRPRLLGMGRGAPANPADPLADNPPVMGPAGRLHLTLADWARFVRIVLVGGEPALLRPDTIARLVDPAPGGGPRQGMGWAYPPSSRGKGLPDVAFGQQGSNRRWVTTALVNGARDRAALVACNDGRARLLRSTPLLAVELLREG